MSRIIISFREETKAMASYIHQHLVKHFNANELILGVGALIEPGDDFIQVIEQSISRAGALIVVIGTHWSEKEKGRTWLENPRDYDFLAVATALAKNVRVVPLLVDGATMPHGDELPEKLKMLEQRSELAIHNEADLDRLVAMLKKITSQTPLPPAQAIVAVPPAPAVRAVVTTPVPQAVAFSAAPTPSSGPTAPVVVPNMIKNMDSLARAKIVSTAKWVNVLRTPEFGSLVITYAKRGKTYPVIGRSFDGQWWQLVVKGIPGWVSASSLKLYRVEDVPSTLVREGGKPSAMEVYFLHALTQRRRAVYNRRGWTYKDVVLRHTAWADQAPVFIPPNEIDPEYLRPAEGGVGILERQAIRRTWTYRIFLAVYIGALFVGGGAVESPIGIPLLLLVVALSFWSVFQGWGFIHGNYQTRQQAMALLKSRAAMTAGALAVGATAAGVAYSAHRAKKTGKPMDIAGTIEKVGKGVGAAAPAIGTVGAALLGNEVLKRREEARLERVETENKSVVKNHTFISYRRADGSHAQVLYDRLRQKFGPNDVFFDINEIPLGEPFPQVLQQRLAESKVLLVVIGPGWLSDHNLQRLTDSRDFVRHEILAGLHNPKTLVIPVLVGKALMPSAEKLPVELHPLLECNAIDMPPDYIDAAVGRIEAAINAALARYVPFA